MKKFLFGVSLMVVGAIITAGALIGGALVAQPFSSDILNSYDAATFIVLGMLIIIIGLIISAVFAFKKDKDKQQ